MEKRSIQPRNGFKQEIEQLGLTWSDNYWKEDSYYSFTSDQISELEEATENVHQMFIAAGEHIIRNNLFADFDIPKEFIPMLVESWNDDNTPCLNLGRFDFGYDGKSSPKLFEYNCDTPTSLLEASVIQWQWKEQVFSDKDQFNSIHEKLVARYRNLGFRNMHFACVEGNAGEDIITTNYHMDCAAEAGINPGFIFMKDIGTDGQEFFDLKDQHIDALYHLYPWEMLVRESYSKAILTSTTKFIEPIWKMLWSNKAILPILWELFPNHPNLLESHRGTTMKGNYVIKPTLSREGANITIVNGANTTATDGQYFDSKMIVQELYNLPKFGDKYPVIGSWCVDGYAAGMGIREDGLITSNTANFIPHIIEN